MRKCIAILMTLALAVTLGACGAGEETTVTGMVVSVDGTVVTLMEMDTGSMGGMDFAAGEQPSMPADMEGFQGPGNFNPEDFDGTMPEGFDGTMPEGGNVPQWGGGEMPEGFEGTMPEGFDGEMPDFSGEGGMSGFSAEGETREVDIGDAHISVEIDGGKASGSLEEIVPGAFVTITMNGKGQATNVLISSQSGFGGGFFRGSN